jgi:hypothetical protein
MICYWAEHCMLQPSLWFVTGQNNVCYDQVYDLLLVRTLCCDQVYDLLLVRTLYVTTKFMICYWSERCMLRPRLWFITGLRTLYVTTSLWFMICYWSENCMVRPGLWFVTGQKTVCYDHVDDLLLVWTLYCKIRFIICYWSEHCMLRPSWWFVTGQNTVL